MKKLLIAFALVAASTAQASQNMLRSCYEMAGIPAPKSTQQDTALFLIIDQTVVLDGKLKSILVENVRPFLRPGNSFNVSDFSAFSQGRYAQVLTAGELSKLIPQDQRDDIGKPQLQKFDQCIDLQQKAAAKFMSQAMIAAFNGSTDSLGKSDVLATMQELSKFIRATPAKTKIVLLASDMLENSSITSFYQNQAVRKVDVQAEMKKVLTNNLLADFGGAKIYVVGAGLLGTAAKNSYRDPMTMQSLEVFWTEYFRKSHATIGEFGKPALLRPVQ